MRSAACRICSMGGGGSDEGRAVRIEPIAYRASSFWNPMRRSAPLAVSYSFSTSGVSVWAVGLASEGDAGFGFVSSDLRWRLSMHAFTRASPNVRLAAWRLWPAQYTRILDASLSPPF